MIGLGLGNNRIAGGLDPVAQVIAEFVRRVNADGGTVESLLGVNSILRNSPEASLILTPSAYKTSVLYSIVPNTASGDFDYTQNTANGTRFNQNGEIEVLPANTPRITWINGKPEILVEEGRTCLNAQSDNLDTAPWSITASTELDNVGFFAGINKWRLTNTNTAGIVGSGFSALQNTTGFALTAGNDYTISFIIEFGTSPAFGMLLRADTLSVINLTINSDLTFSNLTDDGSYSNLTGRFTEIQNSGIYICEISFTAVNTENYQPLLRMGNCIQGNVSSAVANTTTFIGNFNLTQGDRASSRIITGAGIATRNDDVYSITPPAGTTEIVEYLANGTINTITVIPPTYTPAVGLYKRIIFKS